MLFIVALWHGFGKMKIHTDISAQIFRGMTTELGRVLRQYKRKVCSHFHTQETPAEYTRRMHRFAKQGEQATLNTDNRRSRTVKKEYNDNTYKHHSLGDYVDAIIRFGATPSLSSQTVCHYSFLLRPRLILVINQSAG
jgi:hypothetical protein